MDDEPEYEVLREVYEITEKRDGAVFSTRYIGLQWVPYGSTAPKGFQYVVLNGGLDIMTIRRKSK